IVHSRHRSVHNFIMNICSALTAYCFFDNKPQALPVQFESSTQFAMF
ncbi:MAG: IS982 family transposase, partial [bacterium]|nr:IS982 family transposase [Candidatus Aphodosoma intestinipullorum]